jgi:hypothetical protein
VWSNEQLCSLAGEMDWICDENNYSRLGESAIHRGFILRMVVGKVVLTKLGRV